ncbi:hypothetical protein M569_01331 [Genlisea aurea]|uniref:Plastid division protein PDV1 n=1 Tax=Genlisea aurea TaxID=192259 RepID=S8ELC7_9LAMI|nr:hypothetical protein M569_01331 [Genlisea aurea]
MKWEMEVDEIETVLEKILDLHDKLSDAIHTISRAHFLNSVKNPPRKSDEFVSRKKSGYDGRGQGFVFFKEYRVDDDDELAAVQDAKSLYAIRTALENLEDQLEFFHTVQIQQRAERDSAIARLEQSRIILAMRLAEHQGQKYKVIEEAQALVGDVRDPGLFVATENHYSSTPHPSDVGYHQLHRQKKPDGIISFLLSSFDLVSKTLKLDSTLGIMGNAALFAVSMFALLHANQVCCKEKEDSRGTRKSLPYDNLDVKLARG